MCTAMEQPFYRDEPFAGGYCRAELDYKTLKAAPRPDGGFFPAGGGGFFAAPRDEPDGFADGFVKALDELHGLGQLPPPNVALPEPPPVYAALGAYAAAPSPPLPAPPPPGAFPTATLSYLPAKEEPQTVPEAPADAERLKAERKRLRNRLAATKCRRRKLERIARLEERVRGLRGDNAALAAAAAALRAQVTRLRGTVRRHLGSGCHLLLAKGGGF